jgi:UDP-N-acetylglucosamine pyrophosphorylase
MRSSSRARRAACRHVLTIALPSLRTMAAAVDAALNLLQRLDALVRPMTPSLPAYTQEVGAAAFVLVAGGLGERLGFSGIKVALPVESTTSECFLGLYCRSILALQAAAAAAGSSRALPLAIMTSGDTHDR